MPQALERGRRWGGACEHFLRGKCRLGELCLYCHGDGGDVAKGTTSEKRNDAPPDDREVAVSVRESEAEGAKGSVDGGGEEAQRS